MVATSALGMGYDKPDLAFCVHVGSPASPVAYYQQVGRAGRALDDAVAVLLPAETDERRSGTTSPPPACPTRQRRRPHPRCARAARRRPAWNWRTATGIRRGRLEGLLKILAVDEVVQRAKARPGR